MTKNKIAYALIAGILAIGVTSASFAVAEPAEAKDKMAQFSASPVAGIRIMNPIPEIKGSIDIGKNIMSNTKIGLPEAAALAETEGRGTVISGNLGIQSGYLTYTFTVVSDNQVRTVIVDAGDGKILHTSEPLPSDASMLISGNHGMFFQHAIPAWTHLDTLTFDEQK